MLNYNLKITPKCTDVIKKCIWLGKEIPCFEYFQTRKTYIGHCCLFNYQRPGDVELRYNVRLYYCLNTIAINQIFNTLILYRKHFEYSSIIEMKKPLYIDRIGLEYGLSVVVNHMIDDNAFTYYSYFGSVVYLFSRTDYLDEASGGLLQRIIQPHEEIFISVDLIPVLETSLIKPFSAQARECWFQDENSLGEYVRKIGFTICIKFASF